MLQMEAFIIPGSGSGGKWVKLNVSGQVFFTSKTTLLNRESESMLAKMFNPGSGFQPGATATPKGPFSSIGIQLTLVPSSTTCEPEVLSWIQTSIPKLHPVFCRFIQNLNTFSALFVHRSFRGSAFLWNSGVAFLEELLRPKDEAPSTRRDVVIALNWDT